MLPGAQHRAQAGGDKAERDGAGQHPQQRAGAGIGVAEQQVNQRRRQPPQRQTGQHAQAGQDADAGAIGLVEAVAVVMRPAVQLGLQVFLHQGGRQQIDADQGDKRHLVDAGGGGVHQQAEQEDVALEVDQIKQATEAIGPGRPGHGASRRRGDGRGGGRRRGMAAQLQAAQRAGMCPDQGQAQGEERHHQPDAGHLGRAHRRAGKAEQAAEQPQAQPGRRRLQDGQGAIPFLELQARRGQFQAQLRRHLTGEQGDDQARPRGGAPGGPGQQAGGHQRGAERGEAIAARQPAVGLIALFPVAAQPQRRQPQPGERRRQGDAAPGRGEQTVVGGPQDAGLHHLGQEGGRRAGERPQPQGGQGDEGVPGETHQRRGAGTVSAPTTGPAPPGWPVAPAPGRRAGAWRAPALGRAGRGSRHPAYRPWRPRGAGQTAGYRAGVR